jgi:tetraacyldisaccharide 4'-kinase
MKFWYSTKLSLRAILLLPLSYLVNIVITLRQNKRNRVSYSKPVIVIGNITVGGTGKTPTIIWLVNWLKSEGYRPAVVSRGYGAKPSRPYPILINHKDTAQEVGDEPKLVFQKTDVPIVIDPDRNRAVQFLCQTQSNEVDLIISDDGMQHYAMYRDIEVLMIDGLRGLGNEKLLPAGPLREHKSKVNSVDFILSKQSDVNLNQTSEMASTHYSLPVNLKGEILKPRDILLCSGIGNFNSFYETVTELGFLVTKQMELRDHKKMPLSVLNDDRLPIVVTEKDFIKLENPPSHIYQLPFSLKYSDTFKSRFLIKLREIIDEKSNHHPSSL